MADTLLVAAGGGGDALAALMVQRALEGPVERPVVASYSWDRFVLDPKPGPRTIADFRDLHQLGLSAHQVMPHSRLRHEGISGLVLLAATTQADVCLLDPIAGAWGVRRQLQELITVHEVKRVLVVDVGGDIIANGTEPGLSSPLADALVLSSCVDLGVDVSVAIAGAGLDGELDAHYVVDRCTTAGAVAFDLEAGDVAPFLRGVEFHPSEATALLAASAFGITGIAETRDRGRLIAVDDSSATFHVLGYDQAVAMNPLSQALGTATTLDQAESITTSLYGSSELAYEREKAARAKDVARSSAHDGLIAYRRAALARGATLTTFRRLGERLGMTSYDANHIRRLVGGAAEPTLPIVHIDRIQDGPHLAHD